MVYHRPTSHDRQRFCLNFFRKEKKRKRKKKKKKRNEMKSAMPWSAYVGNLRFSRILGGRRRRFPCFITIVFLLASFLPCVVGAKKETEEAAADAAVPIATEFFYDRFANLTTLFEGEIKKELSFCVKNVNADFNGAFNFSSNLTFLSSCWKKTKGKESLEHLFMHGALPMELWSFFTSKVKICGSPPRILPQLSGVGSMFAGKVG